MSDTCPHCHLFTACNPADEIMHMEIAHAAVILERRKTTPTIVHPWRGAYDVIPEGMIDLTLRIAQAYAARYVNDLCPSDEAEADQYRRIIFTQALQEVIHGSTPAPIPDQAA